MSSRPATRSARCSRARSACSIPVTLGAELEKRYGIPRRRLTGMISPWAVKRLEEFGGDITKFTVVRLQPSRLKQICVAKTEPGDENNQDVVEPRRQGRYPQARDVQPERSRRLFLLGRAQPHDAGADGIRRDVQGADQDAASAPDRDAGGQLRRHREYRRHPLPGHHPRALERGRVAELQEQQEQRGLHRPHLGHQGAVLPARRPRSARSTRSCCRTASWRTRLARRRRWTCCRASACCRG